MTQWELNAKLDKIIKNNYLYSPIDADILNRKKLKQDIIDFIKTLSYTDLTKIQEMI